MTQHPAVAGRTSLRTILELQRGTTYQSMRLGEDGPVLLGLASIAPDGGFRPTALRTYGGDSPEKLLLRPGDLYVSLKDVTQSGDLLGAVARVPAYVELGRLTQDTLKLTLTSNSVDAGYLYWLLRSPAYREYCRARAIGTTNLSLSRDDFLDFEFTFPTIAAQRFIAAILDSLDDKIETNRRMNATLEALARAVYDSTIADEFSEATLGEICEIFDGPHATPKTVDEGPIFLGISNLSDGQLDLSDTRHVTEEDYAGWTRRVTPSPCDVLFSYETRLGQAAWLPAGIKCCLGRRMGILRAYPSKVPPIILFHAYLSSAFQETIREKTVHGSTVERIPLVEMPSFSIQIPSAERCEVLAPALLAMRDRICLNAAMTATRAQLRDLLLPKLLSGALRVRDAERMVGDAA